MNAATNVKQIQGNHTPITMLVGFVALLAIAIAVCAIASSAVASLTGFTMVAGRRFHRHFRGAVHPLLL